MHGRALLPLADLPKDHDCEIVTELDTIRRSCEELGDSERFAEFFWFAREYPRCYRYHFDAARHRLECIYANLHSIRKDLLSHARTSPDAFSVGIGDARVAQIYWDFESFLIECCIALDLLARVVGPAFSNETPPSFSRLCKRSQVSHPLLVTFRQSKAKWIDRLKDYRDCFTHYTPVDTVLNVSLNRYKNGWEQRARIPINPNVREILGFRFNRRVELWRYARVTWLRMTRLDQVAARQLAHLHAAGAFPVRLSGLFFVGRRERTQIPTEPQS
jgi:hypothetical protein